MQLDGRLDDWPDLGEPARVAARCTASHIHLLMSIDGPPVNLQGLDEPLHLTLDWDGDPSTGWQSNGLNGADLGIVFSPGPRGRGVEVTLADGGETWDAVDLVFAPTTAANTFELRLPRRLPGSDVACATEVPWSLRVGGDGSADGKIETAVRAATPRPVLASPLPKPSTDAIRVVSWNLEFGNVLKQASVVERIVRALAPDILLLQEIESDQSHEAIVGVLQNAMPESDWTLQLGPMSGRLRSGIATRLPASPVQAMQRLTRRGESNARVRAATLAIQQPGFGRLLACSVHLKCCGVADGPEDMKRIGEVLALRRGLAEVEREIDGDALIIGGDLNLVGGTLPLDLLVDDGSVLIEPAAPPRDLVIAEPLQPDGLETQTWQKRRQSFSPGRLDYVVYSPNLQETRAIVFDTLDLPPSALAAMNLVRTDASRASDHLPVVVDLVPAPK